MPSFPFLTHVAGLRGIAIILIILFHFTQGNSQYDIFEFKNGFLGVEIFMVLMGYFLILGLSKKREITFIKFITQKISRLLFPLAVTIIFCALIGIAILDFSYLAVMGRTGRSALLGFSNFKLIYDSTNYFSPDASMNCMLHTWYISAALQLFILSYIFFWITKKWNKAWIIISLFFVGMLSLSIHFNVGENCLTKLGIPDTYHTYITSYYSPFPRIWEFISGGLILLLPDVRITKWKNILFTSGILLILTGFFISTTDYATLSVVAGSILAVKFYQQGALGILLSNKYIVWLGNISFSLYLVHMPILVLYKGGTMRIPELDEIIALFILTIFVGFIFYHYVEKRKYHTVKQAICIIIALGIGFFLTRTNGLQHIWNKEANQITVSGYDNKRWAQYDELNECYDYNRLIPYSQENFDIVSDNNQIKGTTTPFWQIGHEQNPATFVVIGDSHAAMNYAGLDTICKTHNVSGVLADTLILPFCNRTYGKATKSYSISNQKTDSFIHWLNHQKSVNSVIIIFSWYWVTNMLHAESTSEISTEDNMACMEQFLINLKKLNKEAIVFAPLPRFKTNSILMYARFRKKWNLTGKFNEDYLVSRTDYLNKWGKCISMLQDLERKGLCHIIDPTGPLFKEDNICYPFDDSGIIFIDCNHYSVNTSIKVAKKIQDKLIPILKRNNIHN